MRGYKVFNNDWTCKGFQYEVGKTYEMEGEIQLCKRGFHFCGKLKDCFLYYPFDSEQIKIAEVEALGEIVYDEIGSISKRCTNKIKIIREIPFNQLWFEAQEKLELIPSARSKCKGTLSCCSVNGIPVVGGEATIVKHINSALSFGGYYVVKYNALIDVWREGVDGKI